LLYFDRIRFADAMVISYHVKVNRMNGSNPESDNKKFPGSRHGAGDVITPAP
jgi:hypothetical protein